jgi:DNA-directed RNA polymerase subunit RPC12/RpoP
MIMSCPECGGTLIQRWPSPLSDPEGDEQLLCIYCRHREMVPKDSTPDNWLVCDGFRERTYP